MIIWEKLKARKQLVKAFRTAQIYRSYSTDNGERYILPKIHSVTINDHSIQYTFTLPIGVNPDLLKKNYFVFQQIFRKQVNIEGEIKNFTLSIQTAPKKDLIYDFCEIEKAVDKHKLGIICGQSRNGEYVSFDITEKPHILIAGETGSGKSTQLRSILTTLIKIKRPEELQLYLGDCKRQEFHIFRKVEHVQCVYSNARDIRSMLLKIRAEMDSRSNLTEVFEVGHIDDLPKEHKLPYIIVCIDEFVMLRKDEEIMDILTEIVAIGRTLGVFAILSMQRPNAKVLDTTVRANLTVSMGFKLRDPMEAKIANTPNAEKIEVSGRFIMNSDKVYEIQAPYLVMEEAKKLLSPFYVSKGPVKEVKPEEPKQLTESEVFNDVN
ncbi:FtsK/SpoIIIE domain-containing protein [Bacillus sp. EB600]|uniref:FtsK/SpoIIIE domain-containing protein n=1 Tax=Bacillus sp. EB600 TaxID=2806345 RepID=UPI0021092F7A|nr:FtsK/SpoIIIE domain-containing protein [Bacillus sp. EB600]MCQ6282127.1 DNA translocase FtsK [Bacillus sp. EB600]